jgi:hypothetical protein
MTVEHDPGWRTSSYSSTQENCVQVAAWPDAVALRDSKDPDGGTLSLSAAAFSSLLALARG